MEIFTIPGGNPFDSTISQRIGRRSYNAFSNLNSPFGNHFCCFVGTFGCPFNGFCYHLGCPAPEAENDEKENEIASDVHSL